MKIFYETEYDHLPPSVFVEAAVNVSVNVLLHKPPCGYNMQLLEECCERAATATTA